MTDPARILLQLLLERGLEQLDLWVADGLREDSHLDFKRKAHPFDPRLSVEDKRNYSRALSGFANSDCSRLC